MARVFDLNNLRISGNYQGPWLLAFIDAAVLIGWTVKGSGDGGSLFQYVGVTGGPYNVFTGATTRSNANVIAGDAGNANAWVVLENGARQLLIKNTSNTSGWDGYGLMVYNPGTGATPAFTTAGANATTIPGAATNERELISTRANANNNQALIPYNETGYYHIFGDSTAGAGGARSLGYAFIRSSDNTCTRLMSFCALDVGSTITGDADPSIVYCTTSAPTSSTCPTGFVWNPITTAMEALQQNPFGFSIPLVGGGNGVNSIDQAISYVATCALNPGNRVVKGNVNIGGLACSCVQRGWGNWGEDQDGNGWAYLGSTGGCLIPWPDDATVPLP